MINWRDYGHWLIAANTLLRRSLFVRMKAKNTITPSHPTKALARYTLLFIGFLYSGWGTSDFTRQLRPVRPTPGTRSVRRSQTNYSTHSAPGPGAPCWAHSPNHNQDQVL